MTVVEEPRIRRRRWLLPTLLVAVVLATGGAWLGLHATADDDAATPARRVRLEVTADSGRVQAISWRTPNDDNRTHTLGGTFTDGVAAPWSADVTLQPGDGPLWLYVGPVDGATATCRIVVDGRVVEESTGRLPVGFHCWTTTQRVFPKG
ncbi:hypothetical protein AB0K04_21400 [Micromonospora coxensis]|uniref:hypothetical protein n=1 Tax=Micromonospora coxensis TaxID=356852 RepID=UPI00341EF9D5